MEIDAFVDPTMQNRDSCALAGACISLLPSGRSGCQRSLPGPGTPNPENGSSTVPNHSGGGRPVSQCLKIMVAVPEHATITRRVAPGKPRPRAHRIGRERLRSSGSS